MKSYNYKKQFEVGDAGYNKVLNFAKKQDGVIRIMSVRHKENYKRTGVDMIIIKENCQYTAEIRTDSVDNDLVYLEIISNLRKFRVGCFFRTVSNFLFYYKMMHDKLYIMNMSKLKSLIFDKIYEGDSDIILKFGGLNTTESGDKYIGLGILVSIQWIKKYMNIEEFELPSGIAKTEKIPF